MAFEGAGTSPGLAIWRIEDFAPVPYDESKYGKFHVGDSYIVLNTKEGRKGKLTWDVHFWLGKETTQDESGSAAILAVELDEQFDGAAIQHRECQGAESPMFLSYFKNGVRYLAGGVKSGFTHYDPEDVPRRLFKVKGKRNVQVMEVPLALSSLNKSDCFILDEGKNHSILVLMPPGARKMEQFRAVQVANEIRDEDHAGDAEVEVLDQYSDNMQKFFDSLGEGSVDEIPEEEGDDEASDILAKKTVKLFKIEGEGVSEIAEAPLSQEMLESTSAFILFGGKAGLFVWLGKDSEISTGPKEERSKLFQIAENLAIENGLPRSTKVERIVEGLETAIFKQYFMHWNETDNENIGFGRSYGEGAIAEWKIDDLHLEARKRIARSAGAAIGFMPDNGEGEKEVWRVEDMELAEVPEAQKSFLYDGDCYVIQYTYDGGHIVYFWQGINCSIDERGASAIHAARIDNEQLDGNAIQVRVVQGQEPRHFIKMFGGDLVILNGGKGSGFRNVNQEDEVDQSVTKLFKVQSVSGKDDTRAVQVPIDADIFSDDVYILSTPEGVIIWKGEERESIEVEAEQAVRIAELLFNTTDVTLTSMNDDKEDDFWNALGGRRDAKSSSDFNKPILEPRLFHITEKRAYEIFNFTQTDLVSDDVMILDAGEEVYVWIGQEADEEEKVKGLKMAQNYLDTDPTMRNADNGLVITVKQNQEPDSFKRIFADWP